VKSSQVVTIDEAPAYYTNLINRRRRNAWAYNFRALAWEYKGELDRAIADFGEKLRLVPTAVTYNNRGNVWEAKREFDRAIADFDEAIRLDPNYKIAYNNRGNAWRAKKGYEKAIADYNHAIHLDPSYSSPYNGLAWLYATCSDGAHRDGAKAVRFATRACELSGWSNADKIATLAAAYAEAGDFEAAIGYQQKAIDLRHSDTAFITTSNSRLELFRDKRPYRESGENE
jgi:tetratricopeptide (TPR) repeat protein